LLTLELAGQGILAMGRFVSTIALMSSLAMLLPAGAGAGSSTYEPTYPPRIIAASAAAKSFYVEFRAREDGGFGHSYLTLGTVDTIGQVRQTVVVGFMPKGAEDDRWSKFAIPVTGSVGVSRSDFVRRPNARFRVAINRVTYFRLVNKVRDLRNAWTTYELFVRNCNNFLAEIASSAGLRTPIITAQYPVHYVMDLRALNSR
jgi:hypothetical protein